MKPARGNPVAGIVQNRRRCNATGVKLAAKPCGKKHVLESHVGPAFRLNPHVGNRTHQVDIGDELGKCAHRAEPLVVSRWRDALFIPSDVCQRRRAYLRWRERLRSGV